MAQGLQLVRRLGEYMPLPERQHARQSQAVHPALLPGRVFLLAVRHPHPADQDMPSLMRQNLRRIEVKAMVELLEAPVHEHLHRVHRGMSYDIPCLIDVLSVVCTRLHTLRAECEHIIVAEGEQVRTLPHIAEILQLRPEFPEKRPAVRRLPVDKHTAALLLCLCADDKVTGAAPVKEIGVAKMCRKARRRTVDNDLFLLHCARCLRIGAETLYGPPIACFILRIACVENTQAPFLLCGAARVAAVLVMFIRRPERQMRNGIGAEIPRLRMRPRLILMRTAEGIPLVKNMVGAVVVGQPVRVVDEAKRHLQMKAVVPAVREGKSLRKAGVNCPLVKILHSAHSSGRKKTKIRPDAVRKLTMLTKIYAER